MPALRTDSIKLAHTADKINRSISAGLYRMIIHWTRPASSFLMFEIYHPDAV